MPGTNHVYISTGNGWFDANIPGNYQLGRQRARASAGRRRRRRDADRQLHARRTTCSSSIGDTDLGSTSLVILPVPAAHASQHLGVQIGKDAEIRLIDLDEHERHEPRRLGRRRAAAHRRAARRRRHERAAGDWIDGSGDTWLLVANNSGVSGLKLRFTNQNVPFLEVEWSHGGHGEVGDRREWCALLRRRVRRQLLHECGGPRHRRRAVDVDRAPRRAALAKPDHRQRRDLHRRRRASLALRHRRRRRHRSSRRARCKRQRSRPPRRKPSTMARRPASR